jgi:hypothetical protein
MRRYCLPALALCGALLFTTAAHSEPCKPEQFTAAIDASGAALRAFNSDAQPKLKDRIRGLKDKKTWGDDYENRAYDYLQDGRISEFDARTNELIDKIDTLGRKGESGSSDCTALTELQAAGVALLGIMKDKNAYMLGKLDLEIGNSTAKVATAETKPEPSAALEPQTPPPATIKAPTSTRPAVQTKPQASPEPKPWGAETKPAAPEDTEVAAVEPQPSAESVTAGYTLDEIRDASKGFFGGVSGSLASVIEHSFRNTGKPTGYILGTEGGGALLAGLRYGEGTLYLHRGVAEKIYWHGPSIGTDVGASGSRTLFLIYNLNSKDDLYRSFTGVDGSAYLVGGVGMTLMKGGDVVMAPIRSGLGIRIGANIGYLKFTTRQTWNPF